MIEEGSTKFSHLHLLVLPHHTPLPFLFFQVIVLVERAAEPELEGIEASSVVRW
jgi:hypothetical protein